MKSDRLLQKLKTLIPIKTRRAPGAKHGTWERSMPSRHGITGQNNGEIRGKSNVICNRSHPSKSIHLNQSIDALCICIHPGHANAPCMQVVSGQCPAMSCTPHKPKTNHKTPIGCQRKHLVFPNRHDVTCHD